MTATPAPPTPPAFTLAPDGRTLPGRRRRWRRRVLWILAIGFGLLLLLRASVDRLLPWALAKAAKAYNLNASYERLYITFLGLDAELWHLKIAPLGGGEPIIDAEYCRADVSVFDLLRGRLRACRLEIDGLDVRIVREADGRIAVLDSLMPAAAPPAVPAPEAKPAEGPIEIAPPLAIDALRLQNVRVALRDAHVTPAFEAVLAVNVHLSDLGSAARPLRFGLDFNASPFLDVLRVEGSGRVDRDALRTEFSAAVEGLRAGALEAYLAALGIRPRAHAIAFGLRGTAALARRAEGGALAGELSLEAIRAAADGGEFAGVDRVSARIEELDRGVLRFGSVLVERPRLLVERTAAGRLAVAGMEFGEAAPERSEEQPPPAAPPPPAPAAVSAAAVLALGELAVKEGRVELRDEGAAEPGGLALVLEKFVLRDLVIAPDRPGAAAAFEAQLAAPGVFKNASVAGTVAGLPLHPILEGTARGSGITGQALRPYLAAAGVEPAFTDGSLEAGFRLAADVSPDGKVRAELQLSDAQLRDGGDELARIGLEVSDVLFDPLNPTLRIASIDVRGPRVKARLDEAGSLAFLGLRTVKPSAAAPPSPGRAQAPAPCAAPGARPPAPALGIELGRLAWKDVHVELRDDSLAAPRTFTIDDAGLEIAGLRTSLDPAEAPAAPAAVKAWLASPGLLERVTVEGTAVAHPRTPSIALAIEGSGLTLEGLEERLAALGLEPAPGTGSFALRLEASAVLDAAGASASVSIRDAALRHGGEEWLGVGALEVKDAAFAPGEARVQAVKIERPRALAARQADGSFLAACLRVRPPQPGAGGEAPAPEHAPTPAKASAGAAAPEESPVLTLESLSVDRGTLRIRDAAVSPVVDVALEADLALQALVVGREAAPARFDGLLAAEGIVKSLRVGGDLELGPARKAVRLKADVRGLAAGPLSAYLGRDVRSELEDGRLAARVEARVEPRAEGGAGILLEVSEVQYREARAKEPYFALDRFRVAATRVDPAGGVIAVDEVALGGVELGVRRAADGAVHALGLVASPPAEAGNDRPAAPATAAEPPQAPAPAALSAKLPRVALAALDLGVKRVSFLDETAGQVEPLVIEGLRFRNVKPIELLGEEPETRPPVELECETALRPVAEAARVAITALPFAAEPELQLNLQVSGLSGNGMLAVAPALKKHIDGAGLTDGSARLSLFLVLKARRRGPLDFDFLRDFGFECALKEVEFKGAPDGPVLAGFEELRIEAASIKPEARSVELKLIELQKPVGEIRRTPDGIQALGLTVRLPSAAADGAPAAQAPVAEAAAPPAAETPAAPPADLPVVAVDRVAVSGIRIDIADEVCDPPLLVPLRELDVEIRGLDTRALKEPRPIRFGASLSGGKVTVKKALARSALAGAIGDAVALAAGAQAPGLGATEEVPIFEEAAVNGRVILHPELSGFVKASVSALQLQAFKGPAAAAGVTLDGGTLDLNQDLRLRGGEASDLSLRIDFTDLSLSEGADGPIFRYLKLPAPLDAVLFALRDANGGMRIPLDASLDLAAPSVTDLLLPVTTALGVLVAKAIANAPLRLGLGVADLFVPGSEESAPREEEPIQIGFLPGEIEPSGGERAKLEALLARVRAGEFLLVRVQHIFGGGDLEKTFARANPPRDLVGELGLQLRAERDRLVAARDARAAEARAYMASGLDAKASASRAAARSIDLRIADTEESLDRLYDLLRPGAERQAERRGREAALALAAMRMAWVKTFIAEAGPEEEEFGKLRFANPRYTEAAGEEGGVLRFAPVPAP